MLFRSFDYTEIASGVKEGERVALLASLALQAQRQQQNDRLRQGMGVPGLTPGGGPGGGGRAGGGGGGGFGGGGSVEPGTYVVNLTVDGKTVSKPVTVLEDRWIFER